MSQEYADKWEMNQVHVEEGNDLDEEPLQSQPDTGQFDEHHPLDDAEEVQQEASGIIEGGVQPFSETQESPSKVRANMTTPRRSNPVVEAARPSPKRVKKQVSDINTICTINIVTAGRSVSGNLIMHRILWEGYGDKVSQHVPSL